MGGDHTSPHQSVGPLAGDPLEALQYLWRHGCCAKVSHDLVEVDGQGFAGLIDASGHLEGVNDLIYSRGLWGLACEDILSELGRLARLIWHESSSHCVGMLCIL